MPGSLLRAKALRRRRDGTATMGGAPTLQLQIATRSIQGRVQLRL